MTRSSTAVHTTLIQYDHDYNRFFFCLVAAISRCKNTLVLDDLLLDTLLGPRYSMKQYGAVWSSMEQYEYFSLGYSSIGCTTWTAVQYRAV